MTKDVDRGRADPRDWTIPEADFCEADPDPRPPWRHAGFWVTLGTLVVALAWLVDLISPDLPEWLGTSFAAAAVGAYGRAVRVALWRQPPELLHWLESTGGPLLLFLVESQGAPTATARSLTRVG